MKITTTTPTAYEFACHSKACAPPPAGHGGSSAGGGKGQAHAVAISGESGRVRGRGSKIGVDISRYRV